MVRESAEVEEILSAVRGAAKRVTVPKRMVAQVLVDSQTHLTADEITQAVQERQPEVSQSTVYRILEEFEALKIVVHSHMGQHAAVYHLAGSVHGHLICSRCGVTFEIPAVHFDCLSRNLQQNFGFRLDRHHVAITGVCRVCQKEVRPDSGPGKS
ncbi:MAG TPA: Fur family transcriptional regulator [Acidimicrobiales bacterium]|nr:Fur family transcriptional regulator [Acidimicrobiales bacterium]